MGSALLTNFVPCLLLSMDGMQRQRKVNDLSSDTLLTLLHSYLKFTVINATSFISCEFDVKSVYYFLL